MSGRLGADPEDLRRLASAFERAGEGLEDDARQIGTKIRASGWDGPDARRYLSAWDSQHRPVLLSVGRELASTATTLRSEAKAQEKASGEGGGSGGGGRAGDGGGGGGGGSSESDGGKGGEEQKVKAPDSFNTKHADDNTKETHWKKTTNGLSGTSPSAEDRAEDGTNHDQKREHFKVDQNAKVWSDSKRAFAGAEDGVGGKDLWGDKDGAHAGAEAKYQAGAEARADASAHVGKDGVKVAGSADVSVGASGEARANAGFGNYAKGDVGIEGFVGGRAGVDGNLSVGPDGLGAHLGGEAFVGGEVKVDGGVNVMGVGARGELSGYAGAGVKLDADLNVGWDKTTVSLDMGAALGLGLGGKVSFDVSPKDVVNNVTDLGGDIVDGAGDAISDVGSGLKSGFGLWG
ncbi:hypothetical protein [Isoptericola sp. NPDC019482]|uniref:hypothetical protein n=1 Tax=Isoptericola sp. NPDC019482 TaxID=3154688 RepID=UPI003483F2ED